MSTDLWIINSNSIHAKPTIKPKRVKKGFCAELGVCITEQSTINQYFSEKNTLLTPPATILKDVACCSKTGIRESSNLMANSKFKKNNRMGVLRPQHQTKIRSGHHPSSISLFSECPNDPSVSNFSTLRRDPRSWLVGRLATLDHECVRHQCFKDVSGIFPLEVKLFPPKPIFADVKI